MLSVVMLSVDMLSVVVLSVAFNLLLCWMSLCWMSLCWVSWRPPRLLPSNIRLGCKRLTTVTNALAYLDTEFITAVKSFMEPALEGFFRNKIDTSFFFSLSPRALLHSGKRQCLQIGACHKNLFLRRRNGTKVFPKMFFFLELTSQPTSERVNTIKVNYKKVFECYRRPPL